MSPHTVSKKKRLVIWLTTFAVAISLVASMLLWALHVSAVQQEARVIARYVLCQELEQLKKAQRQELSASIKDSQDFLDAGRSIPGVRKDEIQRGIDRRVKLKKALAPYPGGCVSFARDPERQNINVPKE